MAKFSSVDLAGKCDGAEEYVVLFTSLLEGHTGGVTSDTNLTGTAVTSVNVFAHLSEMNSGSESNSF